jgi:hypothetical protein
MSASGHALTLDHILVMSEEGAPEADLLSAAGLKEGAPNTHPGQGTACRRFFFRNFYLELLWVLDRAEASNVATLPTGLLEHWLGRRTGACPFGIILRSPGEPLPFSTWPYRPGYLPAGAAIDVAADTRLTEPQVFHMAGPSPFDPKRRTGHSIATERVLEARIGTPIGPAASPAVRWIAGSGLVSFFPAQDWLLELNFSMTPSATLDFRPRLPLVMQYEAEH